MALISGSTAAVAYLAVSRAGESVPTGVVMAFWSFFSLVVHLGGIAFFPITYPRAPGVWVAVVLGALAATAAQYCTAKAFQKGPAADVAALSYLTPVLGVGVDLALFGLVPAGREWLGCSLIVLFGVLLPFWKQASRS